MNWRDEQQAFWDWITRPQDLRNSEDTIQHLLQPHRELGQVEALAIYNNAYHQRLIQISSELYPVTYHTLGEEVYTRLWLDYLAVWPPRPGPMGLLGENLLEFTREHAQFGRLPALLSIIELESLLITLFDREDEAAYTTAQLQVLPQAQWPQMQWHPKQDWALMRSQFDLERYWSQMQQHLADPSAIPGTTTFAAAPVADARFAHYLVRRTNHRMQFHRVNEAMAVFLQGIQQRKCFADLCAQLAEQFPDRDIAALSLQLLLKCIELELLKR